jgi:hypothetical protein
MNKTDGQQLNFNFKNSIKEVIPEDITLDELLYVLKHHRNSELASRYYYEEISKKRVKK